MEIHENFREFETSLYKELDKLKNKLAESQKCLIDPIDFDGRSPSNSLYGQLFLHAGGTNACRFQKKTFKNVTLDVTDSDAFEFGEAFTSLEKVLFHDSSLIDEVIDYVLMDAKSTPKIIALVSNLNTGIVRVKREIARQAEFVSIPATEHSIEEAKKAIKEAVEITTYFHEGIEYPSKKAMEKAIQKIKAPTKTTTKAPQKLVYVETDGYLKAVVKHEIIEDLDIIEEVAETKPKKKLEMKEFEFNVKPVQTKEVEFHKPKEFIF